MSLIEENRGNPEESVETAQQVAEDAVFGSPDSFFESLDNDVNGNILDNEPEQVTPLQEDSNTAGADVEQVSPGNEVENLKKRYGDSTREAQRMKAELDELKPYVPVLDAMKKDSDLVEHVKGYFKGNEKNLKESLKLDEDFRFDTDDLIENPNSESRKVFNAMVDGVVKERTNKMLNDEKVVQGKKAHAMNIRKQAEEFRQRNNLTKEQMGNFLHDAEQRFKSGYLSFDDMYSLLHRDSVNQNVASATKEDMLAQMKNVRNIPTSQGNANSASENKSPDDDIFDALNSVDGNLDNMFG